MTNYEVTLSNGTTKTIAALSPTAVKLMIRLQVRDGFLPRGIQITDIKAVGPA